MSFEGGFHKKKSKDDWEVKSILQIALIGMIFVTTAPYLSQPASNYSPSIELPNILNYQWSWDLLYKEYFQKVFAVGEPDPITDLQGRIQNETSIYSAGAGGNSLPYGANTIPQYALTQIPSAGFSSPTLIDSLRSGSMFGTGVGGTIKGVIVGDRTGDLVEGSNLSDLYFIENSTNTYDASVLTAGGVTLIFNFSGNTILDSNDKQVGIGLLLERTSGGTMEMRTAGNVNLGTWSGFTLSTSGISLGSGFSACAEDDETTLRDVTCNGFSPSGDIANMNVYGGNARAVLNWTAPADNGDPITGYNVQITNSSQIQLFDEGQEGETPSTSEAIGTDASPLGMFGQRITFPSDIVITTMGFSIGGFPIGVPHPQGTYQGIIVRGDNGTSTVISIANSTTIKNENCGNGCSIGNLATGYATNRVFSFNDVVLEGGVEYIVGVQVLTGVGYTNPCSPTCVTTTASFGTHLDASDASGHPNAGLGVFTEKSISTGNVWIDAVGFEWNANFFGVNFTDEVASTGNTNTEYTSTADFPTQDRKINAYQYLVSAINGNGTADSSNIVEISPSRSGQIDTWQFGEHKRLPTFSTGCNFGVTDGSYPAGNNGFNITMGAGHISDCFVIKSFDADQIDGSDISIHYDYNPTVGNAFLAYIKVIDGEYDINNQNDFPLNNDIKTKGDGELFTLIPDKTTYCDTVGNPAVCEVVIPAFSIDYAGSTQSNISVVFGHLGSASGGHKTATLKDIAISNVGLWNFTSTPRIIYQVNQGYSPSAPFEHSFADDRGVVVSNSIINGTVPPEQPVVTATADLDTVIVDWNDVAFVDTYWIERSLNGSVFEDDFSSYPDNATANLSWENANCQTDSTGGDDYCGVNSTSDSIRTHWGNRHNNGLSYDLFSNLGINATDSNGDGQFSLLWKSTLLDPEGASGNNWIIGISDKDYNFGTLSLQDFLGTRIVENAGFGVTNQFTTLLSDNENTATFTDIDTNIGGQGVYNSTGIPRYFNVTFTGSNLIVSIHSCVARNAGCFLDSLTSSAGAEVYRDLRYIKIQPLDSGSDTRDFIFDYDDFEVHLNQSFEAIGSTTDELTDVWSDDFSGYPNNETAGQSWEVVGNDGDDIAGVNTTSDLLRWEVDTNSPTSIAIDISNIIGQDITGSTGVGDFNLTWTHQADQLIGTGFNEIAVGFSNLNTRYTISQDAILADFAQGSITSSGIMYLSDGAVPTIDFLDTTCGARALTFNDPDLDGTRNGDIITVYNKLTKVGSTVTYVAGITPTFTGLGCSMGGVTAKTPDNMKYLVISSNFPSSSLNKWNLDDFVLQVEGQDPISFFIDYDVERAFTYQYQVYGENNGVNGTAGLSNVVLTNDVPDQVQNLVNVTESGTQVDLQWDELDFNSGQGDPTTGLELTDHKIWRDDGSGYLLVDSVDTDPQGWDEQTVSFVQQSDIGAQDAEPYGIYIKPDGTRLFTTGDTGNEVNEYLLTRPFDITSKVFNSVKVVSAQTSFPREIWWKPDGTRMYVSSASPSSIFSYSASIPFNLASTTFLSSGSRQAGEGLYIRDDGLKLYITDTSIDEVDEYNLSTPWDISTLSFFQTKSTVGGSIASLDVHFKYDGTVMYLIDDSGTANVDRWNLSTPWDISTATFIGQSPSVEPVSDSMRSLFFSENGLKLYVLGTGTDDIYEWDLDVSDFTNYYNDTSVVAGELYDYKVSACNQIGCGDNSTSSTVDLELPATIDDLEVFPVTNSIFMNWTEPMGSPDFYLIERADGDKSRLGSDDFLIYHQDRDPSTTTTLASSTTFAIAQGITTTDIINVTRIDQTMIRGVGACLGAGVLRGTVWNSAGTTVIGSSNATVSGCSLPTTFTSTPTSFYFEPALQLDSGTAYQFGLNMTGTIDKSVIVKRSSADEVVGVANSAPTDTFPYSFASVGGDWAMNIRIENFTFIANITAPQTNFTDSGLEDGLTYYYRARGQNDIGVAVNGSNIAYTKEPVLDDGNSTVINSTSQLWYYREVDPYTTINQDPIYDFTTTTAGGWDISTASLLHSKSLTAEDTTVSDVFFSPNGTKMYMLGFIGKDVNEYTLSTAWDVTTATFIQLKSVSAQESSPQGIFFRDDGLKMYTVRGTNSINEYDLSNPWDVSTVSFLQSYSTVANGLAPFDINFAPNGTKMYTIDPFSPDDTDEYTLSTPWDISTATFIQSFNHGAQETTATGQFFKPDGTRMYIVGDVGDDVNEYSLSNPWDISTATFVQTFSPSLGGFTQGIFFRADGFKMYFITSTTVYEYDLSDSGNNVKIDSGGGSATIAGYGEGWLVKSFNKTDFFGSNVTVSWSSNRFGPSLESVSMRVYDGAYNPKNNPDFPLGSGVTTMGGGLLGSFSTTAIFSDQSDTLLNSSISWGSSTEDFVTVVFSNNDAQTDTYNVMEIQNVTISNIGIWEFDSGTTVTHLRGDTETIYQDFWDVGYYNAQSFELNTPENFVATAVNSTVVMDWDDVFDAVSYVVERNGTQIGTPLVSTFTDSSPAFNTLYEYSVYAVGMSGNSQEASQFVTTNNIPSAPANLTGSMIVEDVLLDWDAPLDDGTGSPSTGTPIIIYNIERKTGVGAYSFLANTTNNTSAYFDTTPISGGNYTWKVRAVNALGFSPFSNEFSLIVAPTFPPNAPTALTATTVSGSQIDNQWVAPVGGDPPTSYVLQRKHVGFTGFVTVATIPFPTLFYNNTGLLSGNTYDFRVRADNGAGSSAYSNIASATTYTVPSAPQTLNAVTFSNTQIDLSWVQPSYVGGGITTYSIYRETPVGGGFAFVANVSGVTLSYNDLGLTQNTVYNYRVSATNLVGTGVYSNQDNDMTQGVPDPPINLAFDTNGVSVIDVDWDNPVYTGGVPITGFSIQQAVGIGGTFVTVTPNHPATPTDKTYTGLLQDTYYIYRIATKNLYGTGAYSANLTASTFDTIQEPENLFGIFDPVFPYNVDLTWSNPFGTPNSEITAYTIQRLNTDNITWMTIQVQGNTTSYSDFSPHNQIQNTYRVKGQTIDQDGQYTLPEVVNTQLIPQIGNVTITNSSVAGNVLQIDYTGTIDECFPTCQLYQVGIIQNGTFQENIPQVVSTPRTIATDWSTFYTINEPAGTFVLINTTAHFQNGAGTNSTTLDAFNATVLFDPNDNLFFTHQRNATFTGIDVQFIRQPIPWDLDCQVTEGLFAPIQTFNISNVGSWTTTFGPVKSFNNAYVTCYDPLDNDSQILSFTSFGMTNGTSAVLAFTNNLGDFLGVPVPFIFILFLAAIWTGRSASTGIIFMAVAIGAMGVLGYFPDPFSGNALITGGFWALIVLVTAIGVFLGKRYF